MFCCFVYVTFSLSIFICHHRSSILFMFFVCLFSISFCLWGFLCLIIFVVVVVFAYVIFFPSFSCFMLFFSLPGVHLLAISFGEGPDRVKPQKPVVVDHFPITLSILPPKHHLRQPQTKPSKYFKSFPPKAISLLFLPYPYLPQWPNSVNTQHDT